MSSNGPNLPYGRTIVPTTMFKDARHPNYVWFNIANKRMIRVETPQIPAVIRWLGTRMPTPESPIAFDRKWLEAG